MQRIYGSREVSNTRRDECILFNSMNQIQMKRLMYSMLPPFIFIYCRLIRVPFVFESHKISTEFDIYFLWIFFKMEFYVFKTDVLISCCTHTIFVRITEILSTEQSKILLKHDEWMRKKPHNYRNEFMNEWKSGVFKLKY